MQRILWALTILLLTAANCAAGQHALRVTRVADDLYAAWAWDVLIRTKFCFEQAAGARAVLTSDRNGLLFLDSGRRCAVEDVYVRKLLRRGRHELVVTREEEGLYRIGDTKVVIFTAACRALAVQDAAVLELPDGISGTLRLHDDTCRVEGVFEAVPY